LPAGVYPKDLILYLIGKFRPRCKFQGNRISRLHNQKHEHIGQAYNMQHECRSRCNKRYRLSRRGNAPLPEGRSRGRRQH
jgi:hypothetical protein